MLSSPYISIHTYRETGCGIWVSGVSACCPLRIYLYTHTEKQVVVSGYPGYQPAVLYVYIYTHIQRNRLWYLGIRGISLLGLSVYLYTHTEKQVVVSGYPGYQPAVLSIYIYKRIQRNRLWYLGIQGISLLGLSVYIYTHIQRDKQWYQGIQGISLLSSPYISLHTYRETGCGILVSRVSVCWVFLYTSIHTYRETSSGIRVSRVSVCCPLHIYLYTHTEKQVVVSGYPGYQPAVLSIYIAQLLLINSLKPFKI